MAIIFVGGSQRSGTTLLQTILCQEPSVNPLIQEAKYLRHLLQAYQFGKQQFKVETRDYFRDYKDYVSFNRRLVNAFLRNTASLFPDTRHLVLREPHLTMLFPELGELLPRAQFVCVVRDPRDTVASMIEVGKKLREETKVRDVMEKLFNSGNVAAISRHYLSFYQPVLRAAPPGFKRRVLVIRYEDLVTEPDTSIQTLREFTGIPLSGYESGRDPDTGRIDYRKLDDYRKAWASESYGKKITGARIGRYKEVLGEEDIRKVTETCAEFMREFNYN